MLVRSWVLSMLLCLVPLAAAADPFEGSELLVGRGVKQPTGAKRFAVGVNLQFAPMNMVLGSQKDAFVGSTVAAACGTDTECRKAAEANADAAMLAVASIPDSQWQKVTDTASDDAQLDAELDKLVSSGVISEKDKQAVQKYSGKIPGDERAGLLNLTRELAKQQATSVLVEPNMEMNFEVVSFNVRVPLAMVMFDDETRWNFGNITLDTKFGHTFGSGAAAFGLGYGLSLYAPSGSKEAGGMALADLWFGPKFMHGYLTASPFLSMGFDTLVLSMQVHGELVSQHYVLGDPGHLPGHVMYGKYGGGLVLMPNWPLSFIGELNGLAPISDADPYNAIFGIGGVQLKLLWLKASAAVQFPIKTPKKEDMGTIGGVSLGELASYSVIGRVAFIF